MNILGSHDPLVSTARLRLSAKTALLEKGNTRDAVIAFELALEGSPEEPVYLSYLGLALAQARRNGKQAIELCERAARRHFYQADVFYNLGQVYLLSGQREKAHRAFSEGAQVDSTFARNFTALETMGVRSRPVFPFLPRRSVINKIAGLALARLGGREQSF
jgi:tetratricopeptide (TPR) repeat protein